METVNPISPAFPKLAEKQEKVNSSGLKLPDRYTSEVKITRAVNVQTKTVSINTSKIPQTACFCGWSSFDEECIIGALPSPASFVKAEADSAGDNRSL